MLPAPTTAELATFSGRDPASFSLFADQALAQATLVFSLLTELQQYPDDPDKAQLATWAIAELAFQFYLKQPYAEAMATPYASETIGSYSYAKLAQKAATGEGLGLFWWDLAIEELSAKDRSLVTSHGTEIHMDPMYWRDDNGDAHVLGPADIALPGTPYYINAENNPRKPLG